MLRGLLVVNAFLRTTKYDDLYQTFLASAKKQTIYLTVATNEELACKVDTAAFHPDDYDFVLFWDKDIPLAMQLEQRGLPTFNSADSIFRCDDKSLTYLSLKNQPIPMPRTILAPKTFSAVGYTHLGFVEEAAQSLGFPLVVKECFGSFGQQVYLLNDINALKEKVLTLQGTPFLFQELIRASFGRDIRINVIGGRVAASLLRTSTDGDFRSNLSRGGSMQPYSPTAEEAALAILAARELGLQFAGVDVLFGEEGPILCEVNSNPHFKTTLTCTGVNMAEEILRHIADTLR